MEDLQVAARIIGSKKIHPDVRLIVTPASRQTYLDAMDEGIIQQLTRAGAIISSPSCGPCFGATGGLLGSGEKAISSTNRNFKGRMGSDKAEVYLGSPATVAASALMGVITDPGTIEGV
jgi:3-isopropylmalate/(R)-2-methylmalate dehydratase large subunit